MAMNVKTPLRIRYCTHGSDLVTSTTSMTGTTLRRHQPRFIMHTGDRLTLWLRTQQGPPGNAKAPKARRTHSLPCLLETCCCLGRTQNHVNSEKATYPRELSSFLRMVRQNCARNALPENLNDLRGRIQTREGRLETR